MAKMDEMIKIFSQPGYKSDYLNAKSHDTCIRCKRPVGAFRDNSARFEYQISALCQECQDACFKDESWLEDTGKKASNGD